VENLLSRKVEKTESAQLAVNALFGLMYVLIVAIGILIPVALAVTGAVTTTNTTVLLILGFIPVFVALLPLAAVMGATHLFMSG
jgi:hypothetical protein